MYVQPVRPTIFGNILKYTFFFSVVLFLVCIFCITLHFMGVPVFSFVAGDDGIIPVPVPVTIQTAFTNAPISSDLSCNFVGVTSTQFTLSFDTFIIGDFVTAGVPRVLLYRSPYPVGLSSADTIDTLPTLFSNSNMLVYIDPLTNDLFVAVLKTDSTYLISDPIKNVPLRVPFRVTLVVSDNFLEVYLNGDLQQMMAFNGAIITSPSSNYFFGPPPIVNQSVNIGNIQYLNAVLTSQVVRFNAQKPFSNSLFASL